MILSFFYCDTLYVECGMQNNNLIFMWELLEILCLHLRNNFCWFVHHQFTHLESCIIAGTCVFVHICKVLHVHEKNETIQGISVLSAVLRMLLCLMIKARNHNCPKWWPEFNRIYHHRISYKINVLPVQYVVLVQASLTGYRWAVRWFTLSITDLHDSRYEVHFILPS